MKLLIYLLINGLAVFITGYILPGVRVGNFLTAMIVAALLGIVNTILKPILIILTLPITLLTLGLFTFVINAFLVLLVSALVPEFHVAGFGWALIFSFVLSIVSWFLQAIAK